MSGDKQTPAAVTKDWLQCVSKIGRLCSESTVEAEKFTAISRSPVSWYLFSDHNLLIFETHCNQSFITAAGVCLSPGITGLSVSQAEHACVGARVALPCGDRGNTGVVSDAATM